MRTRIAAICCFAATAIVSASSYAAETKTYTYDSLGRLVKVINTGSVNNNQTRSFCFDKVGNRVEFDSNSSGVPAACVTQG